MCCGSDSGCLTAFEQEAAMAHYYVNDRAQANGDHEVHKEGCDHMPAPANQRYLGDFGNCRDAVAAARRYYTQSNGCYYCAYACHTS